MSKYFFYLIGVLLFLGAVHLGWPANTDQIYGEVFSRIVTKDDTYGGRLRPRVVYVSKTIVNYPDAFDDEYQDLDKQLGEDVVDVVTKKGEELELEIRWIDNESDLDYNELGEVVGGGVVVVFGELNNFYVYSEIEAVIKVARMASGGTRYEFYKFFGWWKLVDSGMSWIS